MKKLILIKTNLKLADIYRNIFNNRYIYLNDISSIKLNYMRNQINRLYYEIQCLENILKRCMNKHYNMQ